MNGDRAAVGRPPENVLETVARSHRPTHTPDVSLFRVNVIAKNPRDEARVTSAVDVLVDTGSELTWLPGVVLRGAGIEPRRKRSFTTATGVAVERTVGYAVLAAEGHETVDEVVFAEPGDLSLLGVRTLEGFGVVADPLGHRLVAVSTIAAGSQQGA